MYILSRWYLRKAVPTMSGVPPASVSLSAILPASTAASSGVSALWMSTQEVTLRSTQAWSPGSSGTDTRMETDPMRTSALPTAPMKPVRTHRSLNLRASAALSPFPLTTANTLLPGAHMHPSVWHAGLSALPRVRVIGAPPACGP